MIFVDTRISVLRHLLRAPYFHSVFGQEPLFLRQEFDLHLAEEEIQVLQLSSWSS
jgi:hypothetical protein